MGTDKTLYPRIWLPDQLVLGFAISIVLPIRESRNVEASKLKTGHKCDTHMTGRKGR